jgi:hypothetical protein
LAEEEKRNHVRKGWWLLEDDAADPP